MWIKCRFKQEGQKQCRSMRASMVVGSVEGVSLRSIAGGDGNDVVGTMEGERS